MIFAIYIKIRLPPCEVITLSIISRQAQGKTQIYTKYNSVLLPME
jgi:hypothetical protein